MKVVDQVSVICQLNSVVFLREYFQKYLYLNTFETTAFTFIQVLFWSVFFTLLQVVFLPVTKLFFDYNFRVLFILLVISESDLNGMIDARVACWATEWRGGKGVQ